jgi:hypothetical protein
MSFSPRSKRRIRVVLFGIAFLFVEAMCYAVYSWLWLIDGHPGDVSPVLIDTVAWICIGTAFLSLGVFPYLAFRESGDADQRILSASSGEQGADR